MIRKECHQVLNDVVTHMDGAFCCNMYLRLWVAHDVFPRLNRRLTYYLNPCLFLYSISKYSTCTAYMETKALRHTFTACLTGESFTTRTVYPIQPKTQFSDGTRGWEPEYLHVNDINAIPGEMDLTQQAYTITSYVTDKHNSCSLYHASPSPQYYEE